MNLEQLIKQLEASEAELEQAKAHVYRVDGAVQMLKHLIGQFQEPEQKEAE